MAKDTNPIPGEITALTSAPDRAGNWHLVAQVQADDGQLVHGTLHTDSRGGEDHVRFRARDDLNLSLLPEDTAA